MKFKLSDFAINGGEKAFASPKSTMNLPAPIFKNFDSRMNHYLQKKKDPLLDLEKELSNFHDVSFVVCFTNCFIAMSLTLRALIINGKDEVIIPSLTYRRMSDIVLWAGLVPRFCDNDPKTLGISPSQIKKNIDSSTAAIIAPHPIVKLSDSIEIEKIAQYHNIPLLFDSVEASGSELNGKKIGSFGDAEAFSLHPSKLINGCEGGYITTNNQELYNVLKTMRSGNKIKYNHQYRQGHDSKMEYHHAIMALCSLKITTEIIDQNFLQYKIYKNHIKKIPGLKIMKYDLNEKRNFKSILIKVKKSFPVNRDKLYVILNEENIFARKYYYPAQHISQKIKSTRCSNKYVVAERIQGEYLLLPIGHTTSNSDIKKICSILMDIKNLY